MLESLLAFIGNPSGYQTPLPDADARHLMGALMVRAANADNAYLFEEIKLIDRVLGKRHGLGPVEAAKMRAGCEKLESDMPDTDKMTAMLRDAISPDEKEATLRALWAVVYADGIKHAKEELLLRQIEEVLGVSPDRAKALQLEAKG